MSAPYKDKDGAVVFSINGKSVGWAHTAIAYSAFIGALLVGIGLHYHKIVQNEWFGYPQEWFPSVSSTIGDRYPERSVFMILIAITSGPRFALVGLWYLLTRKPGHNLPSALAVLGVVRTVLCGGWVYVTSTDDHNWHDIMMILYIVATLPWTIGCIALSPSNARAIKYRKYVAGTFFGLLVPLAYFFIQHKVHRIPGAYTIYAFFEWSLVLLDVAFDAITIFDFDTFELIVRDIKGSRKGADRSSTIVSSASREKHVGSESLLSIRFTWEEALDTAAWIYQGFLFWSILTSLGVVVWYFPLWHMGLSGYEAFVLSTVSPALLLIAPFRSLAVNNVRIVHLLSLAGVAAYYIQEPVYRLIAVGLGVSMTCLGWATSFFSESQSTIGLETKILAWGTGLILSSTIKFAYQTNNPIWPVIHAADGGWNTTGFLIGILAILRVGRRSQGRNSVRQLLPVTASSSFLIACGFGGLLFGLHSLLSDTSTMILWTWEGYPVRGPMSSTHGWLTVAAMSLGLFLGLFRPNLAASWTAFGLGSVGVAMVTVYSHWLGYYGALITAVYLMAVSVPLLTRAAGKSPAMTFGLGFSIYNFMVFFHVWVVAYAFVPGGPLVREHTDWVMMTMLTLIGCGVFELTTNRTGGFSADHKSKGVYHETWSRSQHRKYFAIGAGIINVLFLCAAFSRFPTNDYKPYHADGKVITAGVWTVHFSLDNNMWSSERRMRDIFKELELDVVGLLESDLQRIIMGNRDTTQFLAEDLGMYVDYGPGPNKHTWGAALLSKFPIVESKHHLLPSPVGELAPAIHATLDVYGEPVDVFVFHSGQEEDPEDRRLQSEYLARLMGTNSSRPSILLSYLVTKPHQGNYNNYVSSTSAMHDVDPSDLDRWCEYILYRRLRRVGYARVSRGLITDTELQVAKFVVSTSDQERTEVVARETDEGARNRRVSEADVPSAWKFPSMFRGEGVRGHAYHVFPEPLYYN